MDYRDDLPSQGDQAGRHLARNNGQAISDRVYTILGMLVVLALALAPFIAVAVLTTGDDYSKTLFLAPTLCIAGMDTVKRLYKVLKFAKEAVEFIVWLHAAVERFKAFVRRIAQRNNGQAISDRVCTALVVVLVVLALALATFIGVAVLTTGDGDYLKTLFLALMTSTAGMEIMKGVKGLYDKLKFAKEADELMKWLVHSVPPRLHAVMEWFVPFVRRIAQG